MTAKRKNAVQEAHKGTGSGDLQQTLSAYEEALKQSPEDEKILSNLGDLYVRVNRLEEALHVYRRLIHLHLSRGEHAKARVRASVIERLTRSVQDPKSHYQAVRFADELRDQITAEAPGLLSRHYGVPQIKLSSYELDPSLIDVLPRVFAELYQAVPLSGIGSTLTVAMVDPTNVLAIDDIKSLTGLDVRPVVASQMEVRAAIEKLYGQQATTSLTEVLEHFGGQADKQILGNLVEYLVDKVDASHLSSWLSNHCDRWLKEKRPGLAAIIEAAVELSAPGIEKAIANILSATEGDPETVLIAAQRVRMIRIADQKLRKRLTKGLKYWLDMWLTTEQHEEYAIIALPSFPRLAGATEANWLSELIVRGSHKVAWATAVGILDWAMSGEADAEPFGDEVAGKLSQAIIRRINSERARAEEAETFPELTATLVWVLGATVSEALLGQASEVIATSFMSPAGMEDSGAVRAGKLLIRRWGEKAQTYLTSAFSTIDNYLRFERAMLVAKA